MKYANYYGVYKQSVFPVFKTNSFLLKGIFALHLIFSISFVNAQCDFPLQDRACDNLAVLQTTEADLSNLVCDGSASVSIDVSAGGLYPITVADGNSYSFSLVPSGNNTMDPIFPGVMTLFHTQGQGNGAVAATSGSVSATAGLTPTTMSYIDDPSRNNLLYLAVFDKDCGGNWKDYTLTITCTTCTIESSEREFIAANADGCVSAAYAFPAPVISGVCDASSLIISDADGTGASISGGMVLIPSGLAADIYTIEFEVEDCSDIAFNSTTELIVEPSSSCGSGNVTLSANCTTAISPSVLLSNQCAADDQYTLFIDGVQGNTVDAAGTYAVSVRYTPTINGDPTAAADLTNPFYNKELCWQNITFEDKSGPVCNLAEADREYNFVCGFETETAIPTFTDCASTITSNDVISLSIGSCGEISGVTDGDNNLYDDLFDNGSLTVMGVTIPVPTEAEVALLNDGNFVLESVTVNTFSATDGQNIGTSCQQFIYKWRPTIIEDPSRALITCGLETTATVLAGLDPQLVPHFENPIFGTDSSTDNDFTGANIEDDTFDPTPVDDNGNPLYVAIAGQDHSVCSFTVTTDDTSVNMPCGNTTKFVRRYTVLDCCTNEILLDDFAQYIETVDVIAPVFTDCPTGLGAGTITSPYEFEISESNTCLTTVDFLTVRPTATDDCSLPITYTASFFLVADDFTGAGTLAGSGMSPTLGQGSYRVDVFATDDCDNVSDVCQVYLRVEDGVTPSVTCNINAVSVDGNGNAEICASDFATANDNCGTISTLEVKLMEEDDSTFGSCVSVNCADAVLNESFELVFNLVFRATDDSGNTNISMCPAELQIKSSPQFTCPSPATVECAEYSATANYGDPVVGGSCDRMFTMDFSDAAGTTACTGTGTIIRTHRLLLNNQVVTTCDQTITIVDTTNPTFDNLPAAATAECDDLPLGTDVTASDECSTATVSFSDVITAGDCTDSYTIERTFTATDQCGNSTVATQTITVDDTTIPVFTSVPDDISVACGNVPAVQTAMASDNCDTDVEITVSDGPATDLDCPNNNSFIRTYTATDNCGNSATHEQTVTLLYVPATVDFGPLNVGPFDCDQMSTFEFTPPTVTDSPCGNSNVVVSPVSIETDPVDANGDQVVRGTFTVTNDCGLSISQTITATFTDCCPTVTIQNDIITCSAISGQITINPFTTYDGDINDLTFRLLEFPQGTQIGVDQVGNDEFTFTPDEIDGTEYVTIAFFTDPVVRANCNGVQTEPVSCTTNRISGRIFNEEFTSLEAVEVELMNTEIPMSMTNEKGEFSFEGLADRAYAIAPQKTSDPLNGISTYDLVVMAQHVLGINTLGSPYKLLAADINMDKTIDILDMLELRQLILYSIEDFSVNTSWRFVNANYIFPDPTNPWLETIPELHNLEALRGDVVADFVAVKIGDLDCDAETKSNFAADIDERNQQNLIFKAADISAQAGSTFDMVLYPNQDVDISALQFTLDFDPSYATLLAVNSTTLDSRDFAMNDKYAHEGMIPFVWHQQEDLRFDTDQSITFTFEATRDLDVSDLIEINSTLTTAAAYTSDGEKYNLSLEVLGQQELNTTSKYTLYQNQPNPFRDETVIGFDVAQDEEVRLTVFNLEGRLLYTAEFAAQAGYNSIVIDKADLQSSGVLFYQLDAADYTTTKKMIVLD